MAKSKKSHPMVIEEKIEPQLKATWGDILHYTITARDAEIINRRRLTYANGDVPSGVQVYSGHPVEEDQMYPMIVTAVNRDGTVNGQVFLDGTDTYWAQNVGVGNDAVD